MNAPLDGLKNRGKEGELSPEQQPRGTMNTESNTEVTAPLTSIAEYSKTAAALADLEQRYKDTLFDVTTKTGLADAIKSRAELRGYRVELEKTRVAIKAPALKRAQEIDSEARRITRALESLEDPIDAQINAERDRKAAELAAKEQAERERLAAEELARKAVEEAVLKAQREEIARQHAELAAAQRKAAQEAEAERAKIAQEQRAAREAIEAEQRASRAAIEAEAERQKGIRDAEEERIAAERREIQRKADEAAAQVRAEQAAEAKRQREAEEKIAAERRAVEDAQRKAADVAAAHARAEAEAKHAAELRTQAEARAKAEAEDREIQKATQELADADQMLATFKERFGTLPRYAPIIRAIDKLQRRG